MSNVAQLNARIPAHTKQLFTMICKLKGEHQELVLTQLIENFVAQEQGLILNSLKESIGKNGK